MWSYANSFVVYVRRGKEGLLWAVISFVMLNCAFVHTQNWAIELRDGPALGWPLLQSQVVTLSKSLATRNKFVLLHVLKSDQIWNMTVLVAVCPLISQTGVNPPDSSPIYPSPSEQESDCWHMLMGFISVITNHTQFLNSSSTVIVGNSTAVKYLN
jgi:hypothetical protein